MTGEKIASFLTLLCFFAGGTGLLVRFYFCLSSRESLCIKRKGQGAGLRELAFVAGAVLFSRLCVYGAAHWINTIVSAEYSGNLVFNFRRLWVHWDARHYLGIAANGYTNVGDDRLRLVFFPLYPFLMAVFGRIAGNNLVLSGTLISLACACGAGMCLYELVLETLDREHAVLSLLYFLLNPLSLFMGCIYTESLFLFLMFLGLLLRVNGHSWAAALAGALCAFTRMPGVIFAGFFVIDLVDALKRRAGVRRILSLVLQILVVFCGLLAYFGVNLAVTGDPFTYLIYQRENWFQRPGLPWDSMANTWHYFKTTVGDSDHWWTWGFQLVWVAYVLGLFLLAQRKLPFDLAAYSFVYLYVVLAPTWLLSAPRYLFGLCTLPVMQSLVLKNRWLHGAMLLASGILLIVYIYGFTVAVEVF